MRIYIPVAILAVLAALYTWFWFSAADRIEHAFNAWVERERAAGREVTYSGTEISGFPFRLQLHVTEPRMSRTKENRTLTWTGEALTAYVLPYRFSHVIIAAQGLQEITSRESRNGMILTRHTEGRADSARASLVWTEGLFGRLTVDIKGYDGTREIITETGGTVTDRKTEAFRAERIRLQSVGAGTLEDLKLEELAKEIPKVEFQDAPGRARRVAVLAENVHWDNHGIRGLRETIPYAGMQAVFTGVPEDLALAHGPFADETLRAWQQAGGEMFLEALRIDWEPVSVEAKGTLSLDAQGRPKGGLDFTSQDPERIADALEDAEVLKPDAAEAVRSAVRLLSSLRSDNGKTITVPVTLGNGKAYITAFEIMETGSVYD